MIVGNGLVAKSFVGSSLLHDHLIFASGVSNSVNPSESDFEREKSLLLSYKNTSKKLIYFSTCSLSDPSVKNKPYLKHKKEVEEIILQSFPNYLIARLPTLVGKTDNPHTFFNFFKQTILNGEELTVYKHAVRYLFDVDHLEASIRFTSKNHSNKPLNITFNNQTSVMNIIAQMGKLLKKQPRLKMENTGAFFSPDNSEFQKIVAKHRELGELKTDYLSILKKYLNG